MKWDFERMSFLSGKGWTIALVAMIVAVCLWVARPVLAVDAAGAASGAQVFNTHCAGCHVNGGNIVRRGKNLKLKALQRNRADSVEAIAQIVANGKGIMASYSDRLVPQDIQAVATYVLEQAERGWK